MKNLSWKLIVSVLLLTFGIGGRMLLRDFPNVETLTTTMLLAGSLLGARWAMWIAGITIAATDLLIGNDMIFLFTWSAWIVIALAAVALKRWNHQPLRYIGVMALGGALSTLFFYLYTNFGVWWISGMYEHTLSGLVASYIAGLPFLRNQVLGNLMFVPLAAAVVSGFRLILMKSKQTQPVSAEYGSRGSR